MSNFDEVRQRLDLLNDEELSLILREHDEEQWRPEVFDIVRSILNERGVSITANPTQDDAPYDEPAGFDLLILGTYADRFEAETDRLALEARGIRVWTSDCSTIMTGFSRGTQLRVQSQDFAEAMAILEADTAAPLPDLPDESAGLPCPRCGSVEITRRIEVVQRIDRQSVSSPKEVAFYTCTSCGHRWSGEP